MKRTIVICDRCGNEIGSAEKYWRLECYSPGVKIVGPKVFLDLCVPCFDWIRVNPALSEPEKEVKDD